MVVMYIYKYGNTEDQYKMSRIRTIMDTNISFGIE